MNPKLFHEGQEVVCISKICKPARPDLKVLPDVHYGKLYNIKLYESFQYDVWFVSIVGLPLGCIYSEDCFAPVMCIKELIEESKECEV